MTHVTAMPDTYPADLGDVDRAALARCIDQCFECAQTRTAYADACLSAAMVAELYLRRRVRPARQQASALPGLRAGVPPLPAGLPGTAYRVG